MYSFNGIIILHFNNMFIIMIHLGILLSWVYRGNQTAQIVSVVIVKVWLLLRGLIFNAHALNPNLSFVCLTGSRVFSLACSHLSSTIASILIIIIDLIFQKVVITHGICKVCGNNFHKSNNVWVGFMVILSSHFTICFTMNFKEINSIHWQP